MSGLAGNLTYPTTPILINTLAYTDLGVFGDGVISKRVLLFKKHGITIPYDSNVSVAKTCTDGGQLKSVAVTIDGPCPCEDCDYDYGIDIVKHVKEPGVQNDDFYSSGRFYGGKLESIQSCSGGELADGNKLTIENDIINQITADTGNGGREAGIVNARRAYIFTCTPAITENVSLYDSNGTLIVTVTLGATMIASINALNDDATFAIYFYATAATATSIFVSSINPGLIYTLADGGGAAAITVNSREIWITSKSVNDQFDVRFPMGFATTRGLLLQAYDTTGVTGHAAINTYCDGTNVSFDPAAATIASAITAFNAGTLVSTYGLYASLRATGSAVIWVYGDGTVESFIISAANLTTNVWAGALASTTWGHPLGKYPKMTSDDVFREFSQMKNLGAQSTLVYQDAPVDGSSYCKIIFQWQDNIANLHGASHGDSYHGKVVLYLKQGNTSALWEAPGADTVDSMMGTGTTSTLTAMLNKWSGVYGTSIGTLGTTLAIP